MAYVYRHIRLDKNVPFYIGICRNGKDTNFARAYSCNSYHRNKIWFRIYSKTKIEVEILFDDVSEEFAKAKEIEFISLYKRIIDGGTLANLTLGGDGVKGFKNPKLAERNKTGIWKGKKHTEETKMKMSLAGKGVCKSEEWKANMSKAKKGMYDGTKNPKYRGEIYAYDLDGNFIKSFELMKDAAEWAGISLASLDRYIEGKRYPSRKGVVYTRKKRH